jgi:hypothetical protein
MLRLVIMHWQLVLWFVSPADPPVLRGVVLWSMAAGDAVLARGLDVHPITA